MSPKIQLLSDETINQIAAGEVIENPASVVKELVENSIDAGATEIVIEIKGGGLQLIRVSDNGCGMGEEDAVKCFERFATSKLFVFDDLLRLSTMGFRGEALAAISAIAKVDLYTSLGEEGISVSVEKGEVVRQEKCARTQGTTIEVRSLFYNVPARKKFQKPAAIRSAEITRLVTLLVLAHPLVTFKLVQQEKESLFSSPSSSLEERIHAVLGKEFLEGAHKMETLDVHGFLGSPQNSRPTRSGQYLFINNRPVLCPPLSFAVKEGYGTRLPIGRFPQFVLYLNVPSHLVDVNVHPQKKEVRLQDEHEMKKKVREAVSGALQEHMTDFGPSITVPRFSFSEPVSSFYPQEFPSPRTFSFTEEMPLGFELQALGILSPYLLLEAKSLAPKLGMSLEADGILFVDLIGVRARLAFDALCAKEKRGVGQALLFPETLLFSRAEASFLRTLLDELEVLGVSLQPLDESCFLVEALPSWMGTEDLKQLISTLIEGEGEEREAALATRFARADKTPFLLEGGIKLVEELLKSSSPPYFCPQGKPLIAHLNTYEIAKLFSSKKPH